MIEFFVEGVPVGQGRPRFTTKGGFPRAYDPPKSRAWKGAVEAAAARKRLARRSEGLVVSLEFILPRLKTKPKAKAWEMKPDLDNLAKAVLDALSGVLWDDDKQVVSLDVRKRVVAGNEKPGVMVRIP